jgi:hypothetical protein
VALGEVKTYDVDCRFPGGGINYPANSQHRRPFGQKQQLCDIHFGRRGSDFFIGVGQFDSKVMLE